MDKNELDKIESEVTEKLETKNRFEKLSEKVILTSKERDEALSKAKAEADRAEALSKEVSFFKDFSANVGKYPQASEYQDKILEKVKAGYSTEDAMVSVLAREGKLSTPVAQPLYNGQVAGGSAPTVQAGAKSLSQMSLAEKRAALQEAEANGDLIGALRS